MKSKQTSNSKFKLTTPILFIIFTRLGTAKEVFKEIRKAKPKDLYIVGDGPRNPDEKIKTDKVREYVLKNIDWDCNVKKLFRDENLGTKNGIVGGIDWFFENVDEGIILEDDCVPSQDFFRFCQELLEKYRHNRKIMHISGGNVEGISDVKDSYFFSHLFSIWGWATWKRAWEKNDPEIKEWPKYNSLRGLKKIGYRGFIFKLRALRLMRLLYSGKIPDAYDYQWEFSCRINKALAIIPKSNLISNIGFGVHGGGTHTTNFDEEKTVKIEKQEFPLRHPKEIVTSWSYWDSTTKAFKINLFKKFYELSIYEIRKLRKIF